MRWTKPVATLLLALFISIPAFALEFGEGYLPVDPPGTTDSGGKIEVVEFFWYGCPHCYDIDPAVESWVKAKPENVNFVRIPAPLNPQWETHARFFYAASYLGVLEKVHTPLFAALQNRQPLLDKDSLIAFAVENGVNEKDLRQAWDSFDVAVRVQRAKNLAKQYDIESVPSFGVQGKYKTSVGTAGSTEAMFTVIDGLIAQEAATPRQKAE